MVYTHFGEGDYEQTEAKIKALLAENSSPAVQACCATARS
ncbi:hypothetical protein P3T22_000387 [Paraburkholderia sp. GAS348]